MSIILQQLNPERLPSSSIESKSAAYTAVAEDRDKVIRFTGSSAITFTLPDITGDVSTTGFRLVILNDSTATVTIDGNSTDTVDGATTYSVAAGEAVEIVTTSATTWAVIGSTTFTGTLTASQVPNLGAGKIVSGVFDPERLPGSVVNSKSAAYTVVDGDQGEIVLQTAAGTITLPDITGNVSTTGWGVWIMNTHSAAITIDGNGTDTINGSTTFSLPSGDSVYVVTTGSTSWQILASTVDSDVSTPVGARWIYSADFADGDLESTGTLAWTAESGAPSGVANVSGTNTQCTLQKAKDMANGIAFLRVQLRDGDDTDALIDQITLTGPSPDIAHRLYADNDEYVDVVYELAGSDSVTPTVTVTTNQTSSNTLTGMFLEIRPFSIGY